MLPGDRHDPVERVVGAGVHVAGLRADDDRPVDRGQLRAERVEPHPALVVGGDPPHAVPLAAHPEHLERGVDRDVGPLVGDDRDRRRPLEPQALHVPADLGQHRVTGRRERGEVGHGGAGHEADARAVRQPEERHEPRCGDLLRDRGGRRDGIEPGVLVPRARQPIGRERRGQAAADDEPEIAWPGTADQARVGRGRQLLDDSRRIGRTLGQRPAERGPERAQVHGPRDRPGFQRVDVRRGEVCGLADESGCDGGVGHGVSIPSRGRPQPSALVLP